MFPDLTSFRPALLVHRTKITAFSEDYQQPAAPERCAQSRRIPEWLVANRFSHRQLIHILQQCRHKSHKDSIRLLEKPDYKSGRIPTIPSSSQYILQGKRIYDSVQGLSAIPYRGLLDWADQPPFISRPNLVRLTQRSRSVWCRLNASLQITRVQSFQDLLRGSNPHSAYLEIPFCLVPTECQPPNY